MSSSREKRLTTELAWLVEEVGWLTVDPDCEAIMSWVAKAALVVVLIALTMESDGLPLHQKESLGESAEGPVETVEAEDAALDAKGQAQVDRAAKVSPLLLDAWLVIMLRCSGRGGAASPGVQAASGATPD